MNDKEKLANRLQILDFAIQEVALFLDSHPKDKVALDYYHKHKDMRQMALAEYQSKYGPIHITANENKDEWVWISDPWPWEMEA